MKCINTLLHKQPLVQGWDVVSGSGVGLVFADGNAEVGCEIDFLFILDGKSALPEGCIDGVAG